MGSERIISTFVLLLANYSFALTLLKIDDTLLPSVVRMPIETTAIRASRSAYSTSACPSSARARLASCCSRRTTEVTVICLFLHLSHGSRAQEVQSHQQLGRTRTQRLLLKVRLRPGLFGMVARG